MARTKAAGPAGVVTHGTFTLPLAMGWVAIGVSVVGDALLNFVLIVEASRGARGISIGLLGCLVGLPALFGGAIGTWADNYRAKHGLMIVGSLVASAAVTGALTATWYTPLFTLGAYVVVFALGQLNLVTTIIWQAMIPQLVRNDRDTVKRVVGWTSTTLALAAVIGPVVAGLLQPIATQPRLILLDGLSFCLCAGLLAPAIRAFRQRCASLTGPAQPVPTALDRAEPAMTQGRPETRGLGRAARIWASHTFGVARIILADPLTARPAVALAVMNFIAFGVAFALPLFIVREKEPDHVIAWVSAVFVAGGLAGSALATYFREDRMFRLYLGLEPMTRASGLLLVAFTHFVPALLMGTALFTVSQGMGRVARQCLLITSFPAEDRAKVLGSYQMLVRGLMPAAPLAMEWTVSQLGIRVFLVVASVVLLGLSGWLLTSRSLRPASQVCQADAGTCAHVADTDTKLRQECRCE